MQIYTSSLSNQIEYTLVSLDDSAKVARLSLVGPDILESLQAPEHQSPDDHDTKWRPEYASYMIEGSSRSRLCLLYVVRTV